MRIEIKISFIKQTILRKMTIIPSSNFNLTTFFPSKPFSSKIPKSIKSLHPTLQIAMSQSITNPQSNQSELQNPQTNLDNYPKPLSPPLPLISKQIELDRALTASSKSSLFALKRSDVVFEDQWLVAVNKPCGVYCESVLAAVPKILNDSGQETDGISEETKATEFHLANRLDRDTSGVMVITKSHKVAAKLVRAFTDHKVKKTYIALCIGAIPEWDKITVKSGHGRSKFGAWRVYAASDIGKSLPGGSSVREMETTFEVLSVNGQRNFKAKDEAKYITVQEKSILDSDTKNNEILIRASPKSGRTHQIRLHCQYLGISIKGDVKYEGVHEWKGKSYDGHELHAEKLSIDHPVTGHPLVIEAPLPLWATEVLHPLSTG